jgi:crotonobetainyl-CoA:carnitine CoA-transferase CaiB-like acyl-CoA transferase
MGRIPQLGELLGCPALANYCEPASWFSKRDDIKSVLAAHLCTQLTGHWLGLLEPADSWSADVLDWNRLLAHGGFRALEMLHTVTRGNGVEYRTTRCPIRIDGERLFAQRGSPALGEHTEAIREEFNLL